MKTRRNSALFCSLAILAIGILLFSLRSPDSNDGASTARNDHKIAKTVRIERLTDIAAAIEVASEKERESLLADGIKAAQSRIVELAEAANTDPSKVLRAMMTLDELASLPPEIRSVSEQPFNTVAHIDLQWITSVREDGSLSCTHRNVALVGENVYPIAGADYLQPKNPVANMPISGYLVGETLVLETSGVKNLSDTEIPVAKEFFSEGSDPMVDPVTGMTGNPEIASVIGGTIYHFENESVRNYVAEELEAAGSTLQGIPEQKFTFLKASGASGTNLVDFDPAPFTTNNPSVLFIRAKFPLNLSEPLSHLSADPISKAELEAELSTVDDVIGKFSYGQGSINATVSSKTYVLPTAALTVALEAENVSTQSGGTYRIMQEARAAASADHNLDSYDVVAVYFPSLKDLPNSKIRFGGLASVGGKNHWINGVGPSARADIITHEFGHNFGLNHANYLDPQFRIGGSYFNQVSLDYGDVFDKMSIAYLPNSLEIPTGNVGDRSFFNPYETSLLSWMPTSKVKDVSTSGTFRIYRFDHPSATSNQLLALRVPLGGESFNWVSLRENYEETSQGAYIVNEGSVTNHSSLVDATPNSKSSAFQDRLDAALPVGQSFRDSNAGVTFTTVSAGGSEPNQYIDVKVDFDSRISLARTNILVDEAAGNAVLTVDRALNTSGRSTVKYAALAGSAQKGSDFHPTTGTLEWEDGDSSSKSILVPLRPDSDPEGTETFTVVLSNPSNAIIPATTSTATVTILDPGKKVDSFDPPFFNTTVFSIVPLPDGRVMIGGNLTQGITGHIARLNSDGSVDSSFLKTSGFNGPVYDIERQSDGSLIVGGGFTSYNGTPCNRLARLTADGILDAAFNAALGDGANGDVKVVAIEQNGGIILGGSFSTFAAANAPGIVRLHSTGSPNTGSPLTPSFDSGSTQRIETILIQDDGKILIGGSFRFPFAGGLGFSYGIGRLHNNGQRDTTFSTGEGMLYKIEGTYTGTVNSIVQTTGGRYLVGGQITHYNGAAIGGRMAVINADGALDSTFAPAESNGDINHIQIQPNGRILAAGRFSSPVGRIISLTPTGTIDSSIDFSGGAGGSIQTIALDSFGDIYLGGNFYDFGLRESRPIVKVSGGVDRRTTWKASMFTPAQLAAGNTGDEDDFDNDGILNITELALGLSPTIPDSPGKFAVAARNLSVQTTGDSEFLQATMERSANNVGVWLVAQFSSDLKTWLPENPLPGSNSIYEVIESTSTRFTVKDMVPADPGVKRFVRFRAVAPN